jgi:uncharacterized membrane protein YcaP (DUF421 family)
MDIVLRAVIIYLVVFAFTRALGQGSGVFRDCPFVS